ncbi:MAG: hypothetical protein ACRDLT_11260 [Solirubrobacteraceae bacterium]
MTERAEHLRATADEQITDLIGLLSTADEATLREPSPSREKLGDGTIAALAAHTADHYQRIGAFMTTSEQMSAGHGPGQRGGHQIPRFLRALGHRPAEHSQHRPGAHDHTTQYAAENTTPAELVEGSRPRVTRSVGSPT